MYISFNDVLVYSYNVTFFLNIVFIFVIGLHN